MSTVGDIHWRTVWPAVAIAVAVILAVMLISGQFTKPR